MGRKNSINRDLKGNPVILAIYYSHHTCSHAVPRLSKYLHLHLGYLLIPPHLFTVCRPTYVIKAFTPAFNNFKITQKLESRKHKKFVIEGRELFRQQIILNPQLHGIYSSCNDYQNKCTKFKLNYTNAQNKSLK